MQSIDPAEFRAVADRVQISELLARYHQSIDAHDWTRLEKEVFAPEVRCRYGGLAIWGQEDVDLSGSAAVIAWLKAGLGRFGAGPPRHFFSNHVFEIRGDVAHTRSTMHGTRPGVSGIYEIEHHRRSEGWRIHDLALMHHQT